MSYNPDILAQQVMSPWPQMMPPQPKWDVLLAQECQPH